ncbi:MAG: cyclic nucleotide-binding domain-containing protein [Geodermatophilaceae bacterium]|nr:cyclic nucleotide-binding domain-containing protein [Geodermatophilaceae bacterium]
MVGTFKFAQEATQFAAGATVFAIGDPPGPAYVVQSGEIEVRRGEDVIESLGPGGVVGEMALLDQTPRSATVVATSDCALVPLDERAFLTHVSHNPYFALELMRVIAGRLRSREAAG